MGNSVASFIVILESKCLDLNSYKLFADSMVCALKNHVIPPRSLLSLELKRCSYLNHGKTYVLLGKVASNDMPEPTHCAFYLKNKRLFFLTHWLVGSTRPKVTGAVSYCASDLHGQLNNWRMPNFICQNFNRWWFGRKKKDSEIATPAWMSASWTVCTIKLQCIMCNCLSTPSIEFLIMVHGCCMFYSHCWLFASKRFK